MGFSFTVVVDTHGMLACHLDSIRTSPMSAIASAFWNLVVQVRTLKLKRFVQNDLAGWGQNLDKDPCKVANS